MTARRRALAQRIRREVADLGRAVGAVGRHWERSKSEASDSDAFLNSVALNLHGFYNGTERVMELIAVEIDGAALGGEAWHRELLEQMRLDIPAVRPAVISAETRSELDEYRRFRHRVRNIYAADLRPPQLEPLVARLPSAWARLEQELLAFANLLDTLATDPAS
jgi:hypothetical protein